jgi:hypothetical protein
MRTGAMSRVGRGARTPHLLSPMTLMLPGTVRPEPVPAHLWRTTSDLDLRRIRVEELLLGSLAAAIPGRAGIAAVE